MSCLRKVIAIMTSSAILSVEDSNKRLPLVRMIARDAIHSTRTIQNHRQEVRELEDAIAAAKNGSQSSVDVSEFDAARINVLNKLRETIQVEEEMVSRCVQEMSQVGARLVDPASGLVEFESTLDGQSVSLSWQFDEPEVAHWRSPDEDRTTRNPLQPSHQL